MAYRRIIKPRCLRCNKTLREDGTCQNKNCVRFVPDSPDVKEGGEVDGAGDSGVSAGETGTTEREDTAVG